MYKSYVYLKLTCTLSTGQSQLGTKEAMPVTCTGFGHVRTKVREHVYRNTSHHRWVKQSNQMLNHGKFNGVFHKPKTDYQWDDHFL